VITTPSRSCDQEEERSVTRARVLHVIDHFYPILGYQEFFLAKMHGLRNETLVVTSDRYSKNIYEANKLILKERIVGSGFFRERLLYSFFRRVFIPLLLRNVDLFIAVTKETKFFMEERYRIPACRIKIIPLGVDSNTFYYDQIARCELRSKYSIAQDDVVFVYIGKKTPTKGVHFFIKAAIELCKKHLNVKFMLVGGGESSYIEKLKEMIRMEKLENRFTFIEAVLNNQLYRYISVGDVGVWPLQCSISMLEAMSCGLPIIISDKSGALERISQGTGLSWHEGNLTDLQAKMDDMMDESRRKAMSRNAEKYMKKLDWQDIAEQFLFDINTKRSKPQSITLPIDRHICGQKK